MKNGILTSQQLSSAEIPDISASTLLKTKKIYVNIMTQTKDFEEIRTKVLKKFAEKDDKGEVLLNKDDKGNETVQIPKESVELLNKEMIDLLNAEAEKIDLKFSLDEISKVPKLNGSDIAVLIESGLLLEE